MKRVYVFAIVIFLIAISIFAFFQQDKTSFFNEKTKKQNQNSLQKETQEKVQEQEQINEKQEITPLNNFRQSPEIPSNAERQKLPNCLEKKFTNLPVDLTKVYKITPLGNLAPPGHTLPTEHTYMHFNPGGSSIEVFELYAPAEVYVTSISKGTGFTQDPIDYTIYFALCKDVIGYYNHVKELSAELESIKSKSNCRKNSGEENYEYCEVRLDSVKAGKIMGKVGRLQGNYDFGLIDLSKKNNYVNPQRYGTRSLYIQCPYDYYDSDKKEKLFSLISRKDTNMCGKVMQDVKGTLQGNWFYGNARADSGSDWDKYLSLVYDNEESSLQAISIGGVFAEASVWKFIPQSTGKKNIDFSKILPGNEIYCYESKGKQGSILIQLVNENELKIEKQESACNDVLAFGNPKVYNR